MIRIKDSTVKVAHLSTGALLGLIVADQVYEDMGYKWCEVTSGNDGAHSYTSLHYNNDAFDLSTRIFKPGDEEKAQDEIKRRLGLDYDVIYEIHPPHIHVEVQPRHRI